MKNLAIISLIMLSLFAFCAYVAVVIDRQTKECESKGGTYLRHEDKCIPIKSIPLH